MSNVKRIAKCYFCGEEFNKISSLRHLEKCEKRHNYYKNTEEKEAYFTLKIEGSKDYYLYLDINKKATLENLDNFLRDIWLECCGHISVFTIHGNMYSSYQDPDYNDYNMKIKLDKLLGVGDIFEHEYDFGSTTELKISVVSQFYGKKNKKIELAIRNVKHVYECDCGEIANNVCAYCYDTMCEKCLSSHSCEEEAIMKIVNSPRTGVCAYEFETEIPEKCTCTDECAIGYNLNCDCINLACNCAKK